MATNTERKFTSLRKRLDQMGYRQPLAIESLPLVEKLFGDLLHTTESLKNTKLQLSQHKEEKGVWEQQAEPYRTDNARLVRENTSLHQQVIKLKEGAESRLKDIKASLRRLEHENTDLKFLNTQYVQKLRSMEKESSLKSDKISELQEKNSQAVIRTPGGRKKQIAFRRQRMEIDSLLPPSTSPSTLVPPPSPPRPDPYMVDLLQVADGKIAELQGETKELEKEKKKLEEAVQSLKKQVDRREEEIERLNEMLKGGRPPEALAAEGTKHTNERVMAHLNIQVDFLQQANRELETKLGQAEVKNSELAKEAEELAQKNSRMCAELAEIGELVKQLSKEKVVGERSLQERAVHAEDEKNKTSSEKEVLEEKLKQMEQAHTEVLADNRRMAEMLATTDGDSKEMAGLLERLSEDRKKLQRECSELRRRRVATEGQGRGSGGGEELSESSYDIRALKKERDELKQAVAAFETELEQIQANAQRLAEDRDNFKVLYEQVYDDVLHLRQQPRGVTSTTSITALLRKVECERDDAKMELQQMRAETGSLKERLASLKDGRQREMGELEDRIAELQLQLDETLKERDEFSSRVDSTKETICRLEEELRSSTAALTASTTELGKHRSRAAQLQALVDAGERSRQEQEQGLRRQAATSQESQASVVAANARIAQLQVELATKQAKMEELQSALSSLDQEHDSLRSEMDAKDETVAQLREQLEKGAGVRRGLEGEVEHLRGEVARTLQGSKGIEKEAGGLRGQLEGLRREMEQARVTEAGLAQENRRLREDLNTMTQENQAIHGQLQMTAEEKEAVKSKLQECIQTVLKYEELLAIREQEKADLLESCRALSDEAQCLTSTAQQSMGEVSGTRLELLAVSQEKQHLAELVQQQASEIQQHLTSLNSYELHFSKLTLTLSKMEGTVRQEQEEKNALLADVAATRELCLQLDKTKESLSRQLASQGISYEQVQGQLDDLRLERDLIKQQLAAERTTVENLQTLLSNERKKEFTSHLSGQEKDTEMQRLRQQLTKIEGERLSLSEQLHKIRVQFASREEELERTKSALTAERFQREHIKQDMLRLQATVGSQVGRGSSGVDNHTKAGGLLQEHPNSLDQGGEIIDRERVALATESAKLVAELSSSQLSVSSSNSPRHP